LPDKKVLILHLKLSGNYFRIYVYALGFASISRTFRSRNLFEAADLRTMTVSGPLPVPATANCYLKEWLSEVMSYQAPLNVHEKAFKGVL